MTFGGHRTLQHLFVKIAAGSALFIAGFAVGGWHTRTVAAQNRFGQPKTVIHMVVYKWKNTASEDDKEQTMKGLKPWPRKFPALRTSG